jgi:Sec-independent protein translocase protein TatA
MFALSGGELAIVVFIFVLVWGAVMLPRFLESLASSSLRRSRGGR